MFVHAPTDSCYDENIFIVLLTFAKILYKNKTLAREIKFLHAT